MIIINIFSTLQLDNHIFNKKINKIFSDNIPFIKNRQRKLLLNFNTRLIQLMKKGFFINLFKKTTP